MWKIANEYLTLRMAYKYRGFAAVVLLWCCGSCAHPQTPTVKHNLAELKKYSYPIYGFKATPGAGGMMQLHSGGGTGFFVKMNGRTFLVSAKHVLTRWDGDSLRKKIDYPDTLKIRIPDISGDTIDYPISFKKINDTITGGAFFEEADIYAIEFPSASNYKINSIESFLDTCNLNSRDTISFYGYPAIIEPLNSIDALERFRNRALTLSIGFYALKSTFPFTIVDQRYDNFDYGLLRTDAFDKRGCSGSPLFKKDSATGRLIFVGLLSKADTVTRSCLIVRPEFILKKIKELSAK